ncbi:MAG: precorrin-6A/cobalt-precorrin-6A reductase, partial [Halofilum sp. (in: g-proteobacteria)]
VVTKNSGGRMTEAKLSAARELRLPVVVVERPPVPDTNAEFDDIEEVVAWLRAREHHSSPAG